MQIALQKMIITITGPRSVGKSTISKLVAKILNLEYTSLDEIAEDALKEHGGLSKAIKSGRMKGFIENSAYSLIERQYDKDNFVFDLSGGSLTSPSFTEARKKVRKIAKEKSVVVGMLPSKRIQESIDYLFEREKERVHFKDMNQKELYQKVEESYKRFPPMFKKFCDYVIYTKGKSPYNVAEEIVKKVCTKT